MTEVDRIMENRALLAALELSMLNLNNTTYSTASPDPPNGLFDDAPESPLGSKKSQNITQCVSVPTSEHVAEIVGRQGEMIHFFFFVFVKDIHPISIVAVVEYAIKSTRLHCSQCVLFCRRRFFFNTTFPVELARREIVVVEFYRVALEYSLRTKFR